MPVPHRVPPDAGKNLFRNLGARADKTGMGVADLEVGRTAVDCFLHDALPIFATQLAVILS